MRLTYLEMRIRKIVLFAYQNPHLFEVMRTIPGWDSIDRTRWDSKRMELKGLIESVIRLSITQGIFVDAHPEFTDRVYPRMRTLGAA